MVGGRIRPLLPVEWILLSLLVAGAPVLGEWSPDGDIDQACVTEQVEIFKERLGTVVEHLGEDTIREAHFLPGSPLHIRTVWSDEEDEAEEWFTRTYTLDENNTIIATKEDPYIELEVRGTQEVYVVADSKGELTIHIYNKTVNCSIVLDTTIYHSEILTNPYYKTFSLSPDEKSLVYLAEGRKDVAVVTPWSKYLGQVGGAVNPKIVVVDLYTQQVRTLSLPMDLIPGRTFWTPDGSGLVTLTRPRQYTPCPECTDSPTRLAYIDIMSSTMELNFLTPSDKHVSLPLVTDTALYFFSNQLKDDQDVPVSENTAQALERIRFPFRFDRSPEQILPSTLRRENFEGLFPDRIHPWTPGHQLEGGNVLVVNNDRREGNQVLLIDITAQEVQVLDRPLKVLHVHNDALLVLSTTFKGYELLIGHIEDIPVTTMMPDTDASMIKLNSSLAGPCQELLDSLFQNNQPSPSSTTEDTATDTTTTTIATATTGGSTGATEVVVDTTTEHTMGSLTVRGIHLVTILANMDTDTAVDIINYDDAVLYSSGDNKRLLVNFNPQPLYGVEHKIKFVKFWLQLNWDVLDLELFQMSENGDILAGQVEGSLAAIDSAAQGYDAVFLTGENIGATIALLLASQYPQEFSQVSVKDPVMTLSSLLVYQPRLLSRLLGTSFPPRPIPSDMVRLWHASPLSRTANYSGNSLILTTGLWPQQSERFYERVKEHSYTHVLKNSTGSTFSEYSTIANWMEITGEFHQHICRVTTTEPSWSSSWQPSQFPSSPSSSSPPTGSTGGGGWSPTSRPAPSPTTASAAASPGLTSLAAASLSLLLIIIGF